MVQKKAALMKWNNMAKHIILDTGYWFALYNERDDHHKEAMLVSELINPHNLVVPWPSLYETLNTRFVRRDDWLTSFKDILSRENTVKISDKKYKENAISSIFIKTKNHKIYSLTDLVIREILLDFEIKIDAIVTFNSSDFEDICRNKNIEIISG